MTSEERVNYLRRFCMMAIGVTSFFVIFCALMAIPAVLGLVLFAVVGHEKCHLNDTGSLETSKAGDAASCRIFNTVLRLLPILFIPIIALAILLTQEVVLVYLKYVRAVSELRVYRRNQHEAEFQQAMMRQFVRRRKRSLLILFAGGCATTFLTDDAVGWLAIGIAFWVAVILYFIVDLLSVASDRSNNGMTVEALDETQQAELHRRADELVATAIPPESVLSDEPCSICLDALTSEVCVLTPCGHLFHARCVREHAMHAMLRGGLRANVSCSLCRASIDPSALHSVTRVAEGEAIHVTAVPV